MSGIPTQRTALFDALSSFWRRLFADRDQLRELMGGVEEMLGQAYLDLLHTALHQSLADTPLYRKEYWHYVPLREDALRYEQRQDLPYALRLDTQLAELSLLTNLILNPTVALEHGQDFAYDFPTRTLRFEFNPFENPRIASRQVSIVPTVYATGNDASVDLSASLTRVSFAGTLRRGKDGRTFGSTEFRSASASFSEGDVGRRLTIGTTPSPVTATIERVVAPDFVVLDTTISGSASGLSWRLFTTELFTSFNAGEDIVLEDPVSLQSTTHTISSVVDGLTITLEQPMTFERDVNRGIAWTHQSSSTVRQIGLWAPDAAIDRRDLYLTYGYLVNREEDSTAAYKALLQGIYQYYILGPSLPRIESALNVLVGVPVTRNTSERVLRIDKTSREDVDILTTDLERYELPKGSLRPDIFPGMTLKAFDVLTTIFTVRDHTTDPGWFYGKDIPAELVERASLADRTIDADLEELRIGEPWQIGEPRALIGADENGELVPQRAGLDGYYGPTLQGLHALTQKAFIEEDVGGRIEIEGSLYDVVSGGMTGPDDEFTYVTTNANVFELTTANTAAGRVSSAAPPVFEALGALRFNASDQGRLVYLTGTTPSLLDTVWEVTQVLTPTTARVAYAGSGSAPALTTGTPFTYTKLLRWRVPTRAPQKHNLGFTLMRDYLQHNTAFLSYEFNAFEGVPFVRSEEDIREVLLAGKPSYVFFFIEGATRLFDEVTVQDEQALNFVMSPQLIQEDIALALDGTWNIGDHFFHGGPEATPFEIVVRSNEFGAGPVPIVGAEDMDIITLVPLYAGDPTATIDVTLTAFNGVAYVPVSGGAFTFTAAGGPQLFEVQTNGLPLQIEATVTGTPTQPGVAAMLRTDPLRVVTISPSAGYDSSAGSATGTDTLQDVANYTFYDFDVQRDIYVKIGGIRTPYRIKEVVAADTVRLTDPAGTAATLPTASGLSWAFGAPRQYACPIAIGQGSVNTVRDAGTSRYHIVDWPLLPRFVP